MEGYLEGGGGGGDAELGPPLAEHLVDLLLEDGGVGGAALLAGGLEAGEDLLEVVHAGLGAVAELLVPRRRAGTLARRGAAAAAGRIARHRCRSGRRWWCGCGDWEWGVDSPLELAIVFFL